MVRSPSEDTIMAKLTGPLMSFGARGKLGGSLVYSAWKGVNTARQLVTPANPRTPAQIAQRDLLSLIVEAWRSTTIAQAVRLGWNKAAQLTGRAISGFNLFTSQLVKLAAEVPAASFVAEITGTAVSSVALAMVNLDDLTAGDEAGTFTVLIGDSPDALLTDVTVNIAAGALSFDLEVEGWKAGDTVFMQVRKAGTGTAVYDRSGVMEITLTA